MYYYQVKLAPCRLEALSHRFEGCHGRGKASGQRGVKERRRKELALEEMKGRMSQVEDLEAEVAAVRANLLQAKE